MAKPSFEMHVEQAKKSVNELFDDTSVSRKDTRDALKDVLEEVRSLIAAIDEN